LLVAMSFTVRALRAALAGLALLGLLLAWRRRGGARWRVLEGHS